MEDHDSTTAEAELAKSADGNLTGSSTGDPTSTPNEDSQETETRAPSTAQAAVSSEGVGADAVQDDTAQETAVTPPRKSVSSVVPGSGKEWEDLGLSQQSIETLRSAGFAYPTPVQAEALPPALASKDIIASAQTGTGKTACFVLPMVERFAGREGTFGLVLGPTREIVQQIAETLRILGEPRGVRCAVLIGGVDYRHDTIALNSYPQVIVATPGRLCDHLDRGNVWFDYLEIVALDEADRMLDMGFSAQLSRIMEEVPKDRQTMLFSATIPAEVDALAHRILKEPVKVAVGRPLSAAHTVEQRLIRLKETEKSRKLQQILKQEPGSAIVFTRSKDGATRVWRSLHSAGFYDATYIHSDRLQEHREQALSEFKEGKFRILVATDVAARGLHIDGVAHVVNYDLPLEPESYVHRIGRTGRAGQTGRSTTFATSGDRDLLRGIEKLLGYPIPSEGGSGGGGEPGETGQHSGRPKKKVVAQVVPSAKSLRVSAEKLGPIRALDFLDQLEKEGWLGFFGEAKSDRPRSADGQESAEEYPEGSGPIAESLPDSLPRDRDRSRRGRRPPGRRGFRRGRRPRR